MEGGGGGRERESEEEREGGREGAREEEGGREGEWMKGTALYNAITMAIVTMATHAHT